MLTLPYPLHSVILYGWVNDKWALWMAKRRGGISEPEDKLSLLLLTTAIPLPVSLLMLGLPPTYAWRWPAYVVAGMGMSVMFGSFLTASSIYYLFDCYHTFRPYSYDLPTSDSPQILALLMPSMAISFGFVRPSPLTSHHDACLRSALRAELRRLALDSRHRSPQLWHLRVLHGLRLRTPHPPNAALGQGAPHPRCSNVLR